MRFCGSGADAAQNAEHRLDEQRRLHQPAVEEMRQRIEMADIVAFEFEARAVALAQPLKNLLDVGERVAEDESLERFEMLALPLVLQLPIARRASGYSAKFIEPMLSEHISG